MNCTNLQNTLREILSEIGGGNNGNPVTAAVRLERLIAWLQPFANEEMKEAEDGNAAQIVEPQAAANGPVHSQECGQPSEGEAASQDEPSGLTLVDVLRSVNEIADKLTGPGKVKVNVPFAVLRLGQLQAQLSDAIEASGEESPKGWFFEEFSEYLSHGSPFSVYSSGRFSDKGFVRLFEHYTNPTRMSRENFEWLAKGFDDAKPADQEPTASTQDRTCPTASSCPAEAG